MSKDLANDIYVNKLFRGARTQMASGSNITIDGIEESNSLKGLNVYGYCKQGDITTLAEEIPPLLFSGYEGIENSISFKGAYLQDGTPKVETPVEIQTLNGEITTTITDGTLDHVKTFTLKIQQEMLTDDYFTKENGEWQEVHNWTKIESYNSESITGEYISTTGGLDTGATIYYKLSEPIYLDCTEEQIAVLDRMDAVEGYNGLNVLETDSVLDIVYKVIGLDLPLPDAPIEITTPEGTTANEISFTLSDGTQSQVLGISISGLYGIPVEARGNYVDENDQHWISDIVNFKTGKIVKNVDFLQLTGDEEWVLDETASVPCFYLYNEDFYSVAGSRYVLLCNRLVYSDVAETEGICFMGDANRLFIYPPTEMYTLELFKQWLVENPTYIYYRKSTPTTTDIPTEEIEEYNLLTTYVGTNIATNDANVYMSVFYIKSGIAGNTSMVILFTQDGNTLFGDINPEG